MNGKFSRAPLTLAALLVGAVIGYACSEASRTGSPLVQTPTARAGEVKVSKPRSPKALPAGAKSKKKLQRFGSVIGLKREKQIIYDMLHAHPWEPINKMIKRCNIHNYSVFIKSVPGGQTWAFGYFEYTGDDFEADMDQMAHHAETQRWWAVCKPCLAAVEPLPPGEVWAPMKQVFYVE